MEPRERRTALADDIFLSALDVPAAKRRSFVEKQCDDHPALADSVFKMLAGFERLGSFMETPPAQRAALSERLCSGARLAGRFEIIQQQGAGGMGVVYRARDLQTGEIVALKIVAPELSADVDAAARLRDEISLSRKVSHPNVCRIHESFVDTVNGRQALFFTMEWLDGETLAQRIAHSSPLSAAAILDIVRPLAAALDAVHEAGIVHRDLKPGNVFLAEAGGGDRIVLLDFGLAKSDRPSEGSRTQAGAILGSPDYMAPEQFLGEPVSAATDAYALALVVYELATGSRAFASDGLLRTAIRRVLDGPPPLQAAQHGLPASWQRVVARALSRDPKRRFAKAGEFFRALESGAIGNRKLSRRLWLTAAVSVGCMSSYYAAVRFRKQRGELPASPLMLMAPLDSTLSSPATRSVEFLVRRQLDQSAHIRVVSQDRILAAWSRMSGGRQPVPTLFRGEDYRGIALREGAPLVIFGSLGKLGDEFALRLKIELLDNSSAVAGRSFSREFTAAREAELASLSSAAVSWIRKTLGESAEEIAARTRPAQELTTPDWQALQELVRAMDLWSGGPQGARSGQAIEHLRAAISLDDDFAVAHARLGDYLVALGRADEGLAEQRIATNLLTKRNLTDRESLRIRGTFASDTGQYAGALRTFETWAEEYPNDSPPLFYASNAAHRLGSFEQSDRFLRDAVRLEPHSYAFLMWQCLRLLDSGDLDGAEQSSRHVFKLNENDWSDQLRCALAFARRDRMSLLSSIDRMSTSGSSPFRSRAFVFAACWAAGEARYDVAEASLADGLAFDRSQGLTDAATQKTLNLAELNLLQALPFKARSQCLALLPQTNGARLRMQIGCVLARAGDSHAARSCLVVAPAPDSMGPSLLATPVYEHWRKRLQLEIALADRELRTAAAILPQIPPPETDNDWPEFKVRALDQLGRRDELRSTVADLVRSPGRYWFQAYRATPGFVRSALAAANHLDDKDYSLLWQFINNKE